MKTHQIVFIYFIFFYIFFIFLFKNFNCNIIMFYIFFIALKFIDSRKLVNIPLALFIIIMLQIFFAFLLFINRSQNQLPSTSQFLSSYTSLLNIIILIEIVFQLK